MGHVSNLAAVALTIGAVLSLVTIRAAVLDMVRRPRPHKGAPRVVSEFTRPADYCPATQTVRAKRNGAYLTKHRLLLAEMVDHTGHDYPAVQRRLSNV